MSNITEGVTCQYEQRLRNSGKQVIAGVDEAGRGPLAGPVVAASVIFDTGFFIEGVNDSKKLSKKKREQLYDEIINRCKCYCISTVDNKEIDSINILKASLLAMKKSVETLSIKPDAVLIDGPYAFETDIETEAVIKGDSKCFLIAAASILAKVYRDRVMEKYDEIYPQYGFKKHKGYATKAHYEAISKYGLCEIHRKTFAVRFNKGGAYE